MNREEIIGIVSELDGALVVVAQEGGSAPEAAWGDAFFYYAPDGVLPERTQPFATISTKDTPGDHQSNLDPRGRFRLNIHLGRDRSASLASPGRDAADADVVLPHPLYGSAGWVCVITPAERTSDLVTELLREAFESARIRTSRRGRGQ